MKTNDEFINVQSVKSQNTLLLYLLQKGLIINRINFKTYCKGANVIICERLASRIHDVKKMLIGTGSEIESKLVVNGKVKYAEYKLVKI